MDCIQSACMCSYDHLAIHYPYFLNSFILEISSYNVLTQLIHHPFILKRMDCLWQSVAHLYNVITIECSKQKSTSEVLNSVE